MHRLDLLQDRHKDKRCVIVANGPSLNQIDFSLIKNEFTIGMNKIFLGFEKFHFYPRYYVAVNDKVIKQSLQEIKKLNCVKFISNHGADGVLAEDGLTYHINTTHPAGRFCKDIRHGVHEGWTVTYAALQIAYYLGFAEVIIIGMDHTYDYEGLPNESKRMEGADPNHFSSDYFGYGQDWDNPDMPNMEASYQLAKETFELSGRKIIDATIDGRCTIFEKQNFHSLFPAAS